MSSGILSSIFEGGLVAVEDPYFHLILEFLVPLIGGIFYGTKAVYVLKVNFEAAFPKLMWLFSD